MRPFLPCLPLAACLVFPGHAVAWCWQEAAEAYGHDPMELVAIACVESRLNPAALSPVGARGVMQVMPGNARSIGMDPDWLWEPCVNIKMGAFVLSQMKSRHGDTWEAVGAYNAACTRLKGVACVKARTDYAWSVYRARVALDQSGRCG